MDLKGKKYSSKKHPMLEEIFFLKYEGSPKKQKKITFTLKDISHAYSKVGIPEPASISNTILDLTRKKNHISSRLPESIYSLGYDLRKKTGPSANGNYAGEFVYVGVGKEINSWIIWKDADETLTISSKNIPKKVSKYLRNDEGALFSVIDYCDVLSIALKQQKNTIVRVQNPMKWQPNEIDGFYVNLNNDTLYPIEAKALTTKDEINLEQMKGGLKIIIKKLGGSSIRFQSIACKMIKNGLKIALFEEEKSNKNDVDLKIKKFIDIKFEPEIKNWI